MLLDALRLRTSKLFGLRAKRKFYNCSPFLRQNCRKTASCSASAVAIASIRPFDFFWVARAASVAPSAVFWFGSASAFDC